MFLIYNKKISINMKTKVEINGYEIEIEEKDGLIIVKAEKDEEIVEEFTIEMEEGEEGQGQEEVQGFEDFEGGEEEGDFDGDDSEGEGFEDEDESKLESFQSFVNKNIKK